MKRRDVLKTMGGVAVAGITSESLATTKAAAKTSVTPLKATASKELADAWVEYHATLEDMRKLMETIPRFQESPLDRAKAYHTLMEMQAMAYNFAVAPRLLHPRLFFNLSWNTDVYTLAQNCQDFNYCMSYLDGRQRYRLSGNMGDLSMLVCQVFNGCWGEPGVKTIGNYDWADFNVGADGHFQVTLSATQESGNWIKIDPAIRYQMIFFRRAIADWNGDSGALKIERISELPDDYYAADEFDEAAMAVRILRATNFVRFIVNTCNISLYDKYLAAAKGQKNVLAALPGEASGTGASPSSNYAMGVFDLQEDEALIIEMSKVPDGAYWSFQLGDVWSRSLNFSSHQSTLNMREIAVDGDGALRVVVARKDPGINNWLDTCGHQNGTVIFRNYRSKTAPVPSPRKVKFSELVALLPTDTKLVTTTDRKEMLALRRQGLLKRYGE